MNMHITMTALFSKCVSTLRVCVNECCWRLVSSSLNAASDDLNVAVTGTALLDTSANKAKRQLASSGALAGRRPPSHRRHSDSVVRSASCCSCCL